MTISLEWRGATSLAVAADGLTRDALLERSELEIAKQTIPLGNRLVELGELFRVERSSVDSRQFDVVVRGDMSNVRGLGKGWNAGSLLIEGEGGSEVGMGMSGGRIVVEGNVGDDAGLEMLGGELTIEGNCGHSLGGAREGARLGMRNGRIIVNGNAKDDVGRRMRRGLIALSGNSGDGLGTRMVAGSIFVFGEVGRAAGFGMKRGTLGLFGDAPTSLLPTFADSGAYRLPFLNLYFRSLSASGLPVAPGMSLRTFHRYNGDLAEVGGGRGEILTCVPVD